MVVGVCACAVQRLVRLMGVVLVSVDGSSDSATSGGGSATMRRKLVVWTQRHRRPLTVVVYVVLLSVLAVVAFVPSYLDAVLGTVSGAGAVTVHVSVTSHRQPLTQNYQ